MKKDQVIETEKDDIEDPTVRWTVNHRPPEKEDKNGSVAHPFGNTVSNDLSVGYIGPDRKGTPLEYMGDNSFYFIIDLGKSFKIDKLEVVNACIDPSLYNVREYEIGVSDDIAV